MSGLPSPPDAPLSLWKRLVRLHVVVPLVVAGLLVVVTPAAFHRYSNFNGSTCPSYLLPDTIWPTGAFVAVTLAFLVGGLLGRLGQRPSDGPSHLALFAAQLGLTAFTAALTFAWWYETRALASGGSLEPITYYVMCIKNTQNDWTLLIFMLAAIITGRWLWHQPGARLW